FMAMKPTIGPVNAAPSGIPAVDIPTALARSLAGNQLLIILLVPELIGPSPIPNSTLKINRDVNPVLKMVRPLKIDHHDIATPNIFLGPYTSAKYPPMKLKIA